MGIRFILVALSIVAVLGGGGGDEAVPTVGDSEEFDALVASGDPLAFMVVARGCDLFPGTCGPLGDFWRAVAVAFPGRVFRLSCDAAPEACRSAISRPVDAGTEPVFEFCRGGACERYAGPPEPRAVAEAASDLLGTAATCSEKTRAALAAADAYAARRDTLRGAESLLASPSRIREARRVYADYLSRFPDHPNAIVAAAKAARLDGDDAAALELWDRLLGLEPDNPNVLAGSAEVLMALGRRDEAQQRVARAIAAFT